MELREMGRFRRLDEFEELKGVHWLGRLKERLEMYGDGLRENGEVV